MSHFSPDCSGDGLIDTGRAGEAFPVEINMITIDLWWANLSYPQINVVKIDVEGAELLVLKGGEKFIDKCGPIIFLEIEPKNLKVYPYKKEDILKWLNEHDYNLFTMDNNLCTIENFNKYLSEDTFVARKK
jgi:hypothetical protein